MSSEGRDPSASGSGDAVVDPMLGQILDRRYRLTRKLGEGGMGEVYAADHLRIARSVAIKLLRPEVLTNEEAVKRFEQEAMTASSIGHENIIRIEDSGKLEDGRIYLAMELLEGAAFNDIIDHQDLPPARLLHILIQTCHGLAAAHEKGIVHRDMKPENIYVTTGVDGSDLPKLLDFGIAKVSQAEGENHLTRTGTIFGTPFYMAPEQALGQGVDHRVDVYAMGVIMYEVFSGSVPFGGESFMGILTQHITAEPARPSVTAQANGRVIPPGIEDIILRAMRKEPGDRYQSMNELIASLVPIYRQLAGAGMSTYMEAAHMPPPSGGVPAYPNAHGAPTPMPVIRDERSQPYAVPHMQSPTGMPMQHAPGTAPPYGGYNAHPGASDSLMVPARKSRVGLYLMLLLVLLGAGGGAAFFLLGGDKEKVEGVATADSNDVKGNNLNNGTDPNNGETNVGTTLDAGSAGVIPDVVPDTDVDAGTVAQVDPVKPVLVTVLLNSKPPATVYRDGKKIGTTPLIVKVDKALPQNLVLKRKKYRDEEVVLDGSEEKVTADLDRSGGGNKPDPDPIKPDPIKPDPIKPDPIKPVDPCKKDPNLPECMLE